MTEAGARVDIRALREAEIAELVALAAEIWRAHYAGIITAAQIEYMLAQRYNEALIRAELVRHDLWWDVLLADQKMTGFASYFSTGVPGEMKLDKLYVHPHTQRRGYGAMLVEHILAIMRDAGMARLVLAVNKNNRSAIAAYRKYGFRIVESVVKDIGSGFVMDDYVMVREIGG